MFTLGCRFMPWTDPKAIADGPSILRYIHSAAQASDVLRLIRLNHRVVKGFGVATRPAGPYRCTASKPMRPCCSAVRFYMSAKATTVMMTASARNSLALNTSAVRSFTRGTGPRISVTAASGWS